MPTPVACSSHILFQQISYIHTYNFYEFGIMNVNGLNHLSLTTVVCIACHTVSDTYWSNLSYNLSQTVTQTYFWFNLHSFSFCIPWTYQEKISEMFSLYTLFKNCGYEMSAVYSVTSCCILIDLFVGIIEADHFVLNFAKIHMVDVSQNMMLNHCFSHHCQLSSLTAQNCRVQRGI